MSVVLRPVLLAAMVASNAFGQKVLLELRPRTGDTLRMQLEQVTEMTSTASGAAPTKVTTSLRMFSRAIVESTAHIASLILAVTDSVDVSSSDPSTRALSLQAEHELEGRQMRLRLWPDGGVTLNDGAASVPREVRDLVSVMPASFPSRPVGVGETWIREMPVPASEAVGIPAGSVVRTRFRFDSMSAEGDLAYLSMAGALRPVSPASEAVSGSVSGSLVVNRQRGWLSESHFLLQLRSTVARKGVKAAAKDAGIRFSVRVSQTMRVLPPPSIVRKR